MAEPSGSELGTTPKQALENTFLSGVFVPVLCIVLGVVGIAFWLVGFGVWSGEFTSSVIVELGAILIELSIAIFLVNYLFHLRDRKLMAPVEQILKREVSQLQTSTKANLIRLIGQILHIASDEKAPEPPEPNWTNQLKSRSLELHAQFAFAISSRGDAVEVLQKLVEAAEMLKFLDQQVAEAITKHRATEDIKVKLSFIHNVLTAISLAKIPETLDVPLEGTWWPGDLRLKLEAAIAVTTQPARDS